MPLLQAHLDDVLSSRSKLRILRLLCTTTAPLSGREVARRTGAQWRAVYLALQELAALGIITREETRSQAQFGLNRAHRLVEKAVLPLFAAEEQWPAAVMTDLRRCTEGAAADSGAELRWAGIFGSTARGTDEPGSDLDLGVVLTRRADAAAFTEALVERARSVEKRIGRHLSPTVLPLEQLRRLYRKQSPLVRSWRTEARRVSGAHDLGQLLDGHE